MKKFVFSIVIFVFAFPHVVAAEIPLDSKVNEGSESATDSPFDKQAFIASAAEKRILKIGLVDCIAFALKNNSEIKIKRIEPKIKTDDVKIAQSGFEPTLKLDAAYADNRSQSSSSTLFSPAVSTSTAVEFNAGLEGKWITGTQYDIDFKNTKYKSNASFQIINPYYQSEAVLTLTQPLLKGAGILVNRADIIIAQNNKVNSLEDFKEETMIVVSTTKKAYYNYIYYIRRHDIAGILLDWTRQLLDITKTRHDKGLASSVDLLEIESAVAQREKELIALESNLKKSEDELKVVTNLVDDPELWNTEIVPIDQPQLSLQEITLVESLENAFRYRPDYIKKKVDLESKDIRIKVAKNQLYPAIDLVGSLGLNGLAGTYRQALDHVNDTDFRDWGVGIAITIPWGSGDRADLDKKKLEKMQALFSLKRFEQNIILDVRDKLRAVDIQYRQVQAAQLVEEKERKHYAAQEKRYTAGHLSTHDLLDYRFRLSLAEVEYLKALIDYKVALIDLDKAQGLTLVKNDIQLEE